MAAAAVEAVVAAAEAAVVGVVVEVAVVEEVKPQLDILFGGHQLPQANDLFENKRSFGITLS